MQSTPFRLATAVIATLLLAALAYVIFFALQNPPPVAPAPPISRSTAASAALTPATGTAIAATVTFTPSMAVAVADASAATTPPTAQMAAAQTLPMATANVVITGAGFVYTPLEGFMVTETDSSATLTRRGANGSLSTIFLLSGGPPQQFIEQPGTQLAARFEQFVNFFAARDNFDTGDIEETSVDAVDALRVDLISSAPENRFRGRIVMAQPAPDRLFIMTGIAPEEIWNINGAGAYGEVLRSVRLFDPETFDPEIFATQGAQAAGIDTDPTSIAAALQPTATATARATPTAAPTPSPIPDSEPLPPPAAAIAQPPGWQLYANANIVHDAVLVRDALWLATSGGIVARNASTDSYVKFSPLEGLARNSATSVTHCPLPGLGLVFGGDGGLLLFDTRNGTWNSLDSANSGMAFDDVTSVQCVAESGLLIIGYRRHGLDLYDVTGAAWTHIDRDDGLVNDFAEVVATDSRGDTIWVSSGFGVTVLRRIGTTVTREAFYSAENSPLADNRIHTIVLEESGVAWIGAPDRSAA